MKRYTLDEITEYANFQANKNNSDTTYRIEIPKNVIKKFLKEKRFPNSTYAPNAKTVIDRHIFELKQQGVKIPINTNKRKRFTEDDVEWNTNVNTMTMDAASKECLQRQDVFESLVKAKVNQVINESGLFYDNRNSDGQEVPETGKYSENVYLKDCPFMIGKDQVEFFKIMQEEKERHTIKDVDDFISSAKKENKEI